MCARVFTSSRVAGSVAGVTAERAETEEKKHVNPRRASPTTERAQGSFMLIRSKVVLRGEVIMNSEEVNRELVWRWALCVAEAVAR